MLCDKYDKAEIVLATDIMILNQTFIVQATGQLDFKMMELVFYHCAAAAGCTSDPWSGLFQFVNNTMSFGQKSVGKMFWLNVHCSHPFI